MVKYKKQVWLITLQHKYLGNVDDYLNFEFEKGTEVVDGCGVTFAGEFWYFGGWYNERQVSFYLNYTKQKSNLIEYPIILSHDGHCAV